MNAGLIQKLLHNGSLTNGRESIGNGQLAIGNSQ